MAEKKRTRYRPVELNRDHARPRTAPAPAGEAMEARLAEVVQPATFAVVEQYRHLGLRFRILTLPVMVALVLAMIWRQIPSVTTLAQMLARESRRFAPVPIRSSPCCGCRAQMAALSACEPGKRS